MSNKISRITNQNKLDKRTSSGKTAAGKSRNLQTLEKKIYKRN
jgi:hypothetical protein